MYLLMSKTVCFFSPLIALRLSLVPHARATPVLRVGGSERTVPHVTSLLDLFRRVLWLALSLLVLAWAVGAQSNLGGHEF